MLHKEEVIHTQGDLRKHQQEIKVDQTVDKIEHNSHPTEPSPTDRVRLKSEARIIVIGFIICLSALMYGYSLKEITSVPISKIVLQYDITSMDTFTAQSVLIGILPIGSIFGTVITKYLLRGWRRLMGIYFCAVINVIAIILVNITFFGTIIAGRFLEGICIGFYAAISPAYLKEIAPKQLRKFLGLFFSLLKCFGVLIAIILEMSFQAANVEIGWRIILSLTAALSVLQAVLIFLFGSDTPSEWFEKQNPQKAREIIVDLYKPQYVEEVFEEYKKEHEMELAKGQNVQQIKPQPIASAQQLKKQDKKQNSNKDGIISIKPEEAVAQTTQQNPNAEVLTFEQKKRYAYILALHLNMVKNWMGGNAIISQGGQFVKTFDSQLGYYTSIIINSIQFTCIIIGLVYVQKKVGKRPLFLFSVIMLSAFNIATAIAMICEKVVAIQMLLCVYMMIYGLSYIAPVWAYPSQIIPSSQAMWPNILNWVSLATSTLIPPLISKAMPKNNPYPVFLFFGIYGLIAVIHLFRCLRESDGFSYHQIIKSFK